MNKGNTKQRGKKKIGFRVWCLNEFTNYFLLRVYMKEGNTKQKKQEKGLRFK
jgi:hypothetical protein